MSREVSLEERQADYAEAEREAERAAERYLEARAAHRMTKRVEWQMDIAQGELLRAKRRLEGTERRLKKAKVIR